jgi:hypothetical protein
VPRPLFWADRQLGGHSGDDPRFPRSQGLALQSGRDPQGPAAAERLTAPARGGPPGHDAHRPPTAAHTLA